MMRFYPWQRTQWQQLQRRYAEGKLPHALLLAGQAGLGKQHFAELFAKAVCCSQQTTDGLACLRCKSCQLMAANNHPDFCYVQPEAMGKPIKIDDIRELSQFLTATVHIATYKIAIIAQAELMNAAAANALLKTLEEPEGRSLIILTSHVPSILPATVRSRCQLIHFPPVYTSEAKQWLAEQLPNSAIDELLALAEGSPLQAFALVEQLPQQLEFMDKLIKLAENKLSAISVAEHYQKTSLNVLLAWLIHRVSDIIKLTLAQTTQWTQNKAMLIALQKLAKSAKLTKLYLYLDALYVVRRQLLANANFNQQLLLERLLYEWQICWTDNT